MSKTLNCARVMRKMFSRKAITRLQAVIMAVVAIIAASAGAYFAFRPALIPGEFELSGLVIDPTEVDEGGSVVISVDIKNVGENDVTEPITLMLNDTVEDSKETTLEGGKTTTVTFTVTKGAGNYSVAIGELTGAFTVRREEWDLVIFGDSTAWGFGEYYAAYIEEELGVKVTVHDETAGGQTASELLRKLRDFRVFRELVSEAEVVTFIGNPLRSISETHPADYDCVGLEYYVNDCSLETFEKYIADIEAIIEEILSLRDGSHTIIRAMDYYCPIYSEYKEQGIYEECKQCFENTNIAIHQAAAAHNVPVARVYDAFNGPNHDEDPRDKGYIGPDGEHTNEEGQKVIAELFHELGYEPVNP